MSKVFWTVQVDHNLCYSIAMVANCSCVVTSHLFALRLAYI